MPLTLGPLLADAALDLEDVMVLRHAYVKEHPDTGTPGIHADSTDAEVFAYTSEQTASTRLFPANPRRYWVVFLPEGGDHARLWKVLEYRGELSNDGLRRRFDLADTDYMPDLRRRLVIGWRLPRRWWMYGKPASTYPVATIADAEPIPFPGFDRLILDYPHLQAVIREPWYASWRTALGSVIGIYLITDTRDGRQYVGKADGAENILQRWSAYAANGHGGNVELRGLDPSAFRYSLLRVYDPGTPTREVDKAEIHFKDALDTRRHGLNRN